MIDDLSLSKNVQFYELNKALTVKSIEDTFKEISKDRVGNYLKNSYLVRKKYTTATGNKVIYSIVSYKIEAEPSFLFGTTVKEQKYAYLLLIECGVVA
ncbi:hypothetical protein [Pseudoalteromonas sp. SR44-2]|uniref:hypothetical protein n=1 Tax=Pseudoalteromonas sp. SR44-2 TaxID=2760937 RepID=UPI0015FF5043|nr:hypothetical protein [Pseudoalteromonas sp. SR44-2]MBB1336835.1 hypothetical protein [Pseudoalteromonas sp. SR44-2]